MVSVLVLLAPSVLGLAPRPLLPSDELNGHALGRSVADLDHEAPLALTLHQMALDLRALGLERGPEEDLYHMLKAFDDAASADVDRAMQAKTLPGLVDAVVKVPWAAYKAGTPEDDAIRKTLASDLNIDTNFDEVRCNLALELALGLRYAHVRTVNFWSGVEGSPPEAIKKDPFTLGGFHEAWGKRIKEAIEKMYEHLDSNAVLPAAPDPDAKQVSAPPATLALARTPGTHLARAHRRRCNLILSACRG